MIKLSQCMIVKNEESNIEQALSWAKDIAYEQIVVDTGSTDKTVEIAEKLGATVYHFDWIDDFSAAKNYAISKATGDWIAFLDADEYFNEEDSKKLLAYLEKLQNTKQIAVVTSLLNLNDEGKVSSNEVQIRLFRNMKGLEYQNAIHEHLAFNGGSIQSRSADARNEFAIIHTGYTKQANANKKKTERNIRILLKEIQKDPKNRGLMCYLGDAYYSVGDNKNAREWFEKAVDSLTFSAEKYDTRISTSFLKLMNILYNQREFERLLAVYEQAVRVVSGESDFDYLISYYWIVQKENFEKGLFHLEQAFQKLEANRESFYGKTLTGQLQKAWELRANCYYHLQNWAKCVESCVAILKTDVYNFTITSMLLEVFHMDEARGGASASAVLQFLANLYSLQGLKDRIYLLRIAMNIHYDSLIQEIRKLFTPEELAVVDSSMGD